MRAWLYYRLSRDEDEEMNSLHNQRQILLDYANQNGYEVVGESFDDNVSGMTFKRKGLGEMEAAVSEGKIDVVLVKDLSRLGRHRTQTALFIDHLRENNVRVYSVTESIDTTNENDDLLIGFKQIFNDFYAKDISKKVRAGLRQKQKNNGLVLTLPLGYYIDRNTKKVEIDEEAAEIVREVFRLYVEGYGLHDVGHCIFSHMGETLYDYDEVKKYLIYAIKDNLILPGKKELDHALTDKVGFKYEEVEELIDYIKKHRKVGAVHEQISCISILYNFLTILLESSKHSIKADFVFIIRCILGIKYNVDTSQLKERYQLKNSLMSPSEHKVVLLNIPILHSALLSASILSLDPAKRFMMLQEQFNL